MANGLAEEGRLSDADMAWWRQANDEANRAYTDPTLVAADCFDPVVNPGARSWFKSTSAELLEMTRGYLNLLDRYDVAWTELSTSMPGRITYEDEVQVIAVPFEFPGDWPFQ